MKRYLIIIIIFAAFFMGSSFATGAESSSLKLQPRTKIIYIDPWYGGKENGPLAGSKKYSKAITLDIARKVQSLLDAAEFNVYLSRDDDRFVSLDQRLFQGKSKGAGVHLAIKISLAKKDCIRIYIASPPIKKHETASAAKTNTKEELDSELNRIIKDLITDDIIEESLIIGKTVSDNLKSNLAPDCVELLRGKSYILKNAQLPTVMVDFYISSTGSKSSILDDAALDKIAKSLADSIRQYSAERSPKEGKVN
jgi:N-acetylmuramoyl-L-alanine amidase